MPRYQTVVPADAGDMNILTTKLRAPIKLTPAQRMEAREWRKVGLEFWEIAEEMKLDEDDVKHALANMRTKRLNPPRISLNVSVAAAHHIRMMQQDGEAIWQTVNRLLGIKG